MKKHIPILGICLLIALASSYRIVLFHTSVTRVHVSGDESIIALQAMGITQDDASFEMKAKRHPMWVKGRYPLLFMAQPYLFPLEAYMYAPFIRFLPRNAIGPRTGAALLGLATVVFSLLILVRWGRLREVWPGVLLVLFPSAYFLSLQVGYALPSYPSFMCLSAMAVWAAQMHRERESGYLPWAVAAGLISGVAFSGTLLAVPILAGVGVMVCLGTNWRKAAFSTPAFAVSALIGMSPYFYAKKIYPGAFAAVSSLVPWNDAFGRLWDPTMKFTLPSALGMQCTVWPDSLEMVGVVPQAWLRVFAVLWIILTVLLTLVCVWRFIGRWAKNKWPSIETADLFAGLSWVCVLLFIVNRRSASHEFRYLLPLAWYLPFGIAFLYAVSRRPVRVVLGWLAVLLAVLNIATAVALNSRWKAEDFKVFTPVGPPVEYMESRGITRCYASYFDAYNIDYVTDEKIICAQPYNERFFGWPLPYKDVVDASTNVAFVLGPSYRFRPEDLEYDLSAMHVTSRIETCGEFKVYTDFAQEKPDRDRRLDAEDLNISVSDYPQDAALLKDGNYVSRWRSHRAQAGGMFIDIEFPQPVPVTRVAMFYNYYHHDRAVSLNILARKKGRRWQTVLSKVPESLDAFEFVNGHPVYGNQVQTIRFPAVTTDALRIEVAEVNEGRDWTVGEIEIYVTK
ncbi:MAG: hypothetical protein KJ626_07335 [Verrucomicrobia bacterium]|nr:hypothetical protein [Verrucomicrobiota bacterium]